MQPANPQTANDKQVAFTYDYMGRRIRKAIYAWDPVGEEWEETAEFERRFVWAGWLMLAEWDDSNDEVRSYTWGLDLSQSLEGAGGIGGLLAVHDADASEDYVYLHDANGNVGQLVAWAEVYGSASDYDWHADRLVAHYEYDPYGNIVTSSGDYADDNPFRFSTKYWDDETGLGYWGYRYYDPRTGRWLSRDPLGEDSHPHLYRAMQNYPVCRIDPMGLQDVPTTQPDPEPLWKTSYEAYGTCSDCGKECADPDARKRFGFAKCENNKQCWCVCANNIRNRAMEKKHPGIKAANEQLAKCVEEHEKKHSALRTENDCCDCRDKPSTECAADKAGLECLQPAIDECLKIEDDKQAKRCLRRLQYYVDEYATCRAYKEEKKRCPEKEQSDCEQLRDEIKRTIGENIRALR